VGTLTGLTVTAPISGNLSGNATTATTATTAETVTNAAQPAITSVGTLTGLTVNAPIVGSVTGTASNVTDIVNLANGGTGSSSYSGAQTNLGFANSIIPITFTTGSTGLVPVGLEFAVGANETWQFSISLLTESDFTTGIKFGFSFPVDGTLMATVLGNTNFTTAFQSSVITSNGTPGAATYNTMESQSGVVRIQGIIKTGSTSGILQLQVLKNPGGGNARIVANSYLTAQKF
jgi:hypothetical protein